MARPRPGLAAVAQGYAWAKDVIAQHPNTPATSPRTSWSWTTTPCPRYGQQLWDQLIHDHDQIFLTLNGHYWPAARATRTNAAGHDVHLHLTNYQNRYYGGAAIIRLYRFDLDRNTIDVETISPWILGRAAKGLNELERQEIELSGDADRFSVAVDFESRFGLRAGARPLGAAGVRDAGPGHTRLLALRRARGRYGGRGHGARPVRARQRPDRGQGRRRRPHLVLRPPPRPAGSRQPLPPGGKPPLKGAYLRTVDGAPLNSATFQRGYTIEAFYQLPADWNASHNAWASLISRTGTGGGAGKTADDPDEPLATLSLSDGPCGPQWAVRPLNQQGIVTNGRRRRPASSGGTSPSSTTARTPRCTSRAARSPATRTPSRSVSPRSGCPGCSAATSTRAGSTRPYGRLGDVRIVERALSVAQFMNH